MSCKQQPISLHSTNSSLFTSTSLLYKSQSQSLPQCLRFLCQRSSTLLSDFLFSSFGAAFPLHIFTFCTNFFNYPITLILTISLFQSQSCSWTYTLIIFCAAAVVGLMTLMKGKTMCAAFPFFAHFTFVQIFISRAIKSLTFGLAHSVAAFAAPAEPASQPAALFCWLNEWMNDMTHPSDPSISIQQKYYFLLLFYFPD